MKLRTLVAFGFTIVFAATAAWAQQAGRDLSQAGKSAVQAGKDVAQSANSTVARAIPPRHLGQLWDKHTVETLKGTVTEVESIKSRLGVTHDLHIFMKTDTETLPVVLGPQSYMDTQNVKISKGDQVEVTGSRIMDNNKPTIIASQVQIGNQTLSLRDADGKPLWSGGK